MTSRNNAAEHAGPRNAQRKKQKASNCVDNELTKREEESARTPGPLLTRTSARTHLQNLEIYMGAIMSQTGIHIVSDESWAAGTFYLGS